MMMMLVVVMAIVMIPAFLSFLRRNRMIRNAVSATDSVQRRRGLAVVEMEI